MSGSIPIGSTKPGPSVGPEEQFFEYLRQGKFMLQRCRSSGAHFFYPRVMTKGASISDLEWVEASGMGVVYASTVIRRNPDHGGSYNIAIIELAEGPRMMSRVLGIAPESVRIGMKVRARIEAPQWPSPAKHAVPIFYPT